MIIIYDDAELLCSAESQMGTLVKQNADRCFLLEQMCRYFYIAACLLMVLASFPKRDGRSGKCFSSALEVLECLALSCCWGCSDQGQLSCLRNRWEGEGFLKWFTLSGVLWENSMFHEGETDVLNFCTNLKNSKNHLKRGSPSCS